MCPITSGLMGGLGGRGCADLKGRPGAEHRDSVCGAGPLRRCYCAEQAHAHQADRLRSVRRVRRVRDLHGRLDTPQEEGLLKVDPRTLVAQQQVDVVGVAARCIGYAE
eukprot:16795-Prorocentrum_minimum.AAC.1